MVVIVGKNIQTNQLMSFLFNSVRSAKTDYHTATPLRFIKKPSPYKKIIYLLDCMERDLASINRCLEPHGDPPCDVAIVLFNLSPDIAVHKITHQHCIRGVFHKDDSLNHFMAGMQAIAVGRKWINQKMHTKDHASCGIVENCNPTPHCVSPREKEILQLVVFGMSNKQIAEEIKISLHTVKTHIYNIYKKIDVPNRLQAAHWATNHLQCELDSHAHT